MSKIIHNQTVAWCDCNDHALVMMTMDPTEHDQNPFVELSIWNKKWHRVRMPLWWRLQEAWRAFRSGRPYAEVILLEDVDELDTLIDSLTNYRTAFKRSLS